MKVELLRRLFGLINPHRGAGTGRQAWLRAMCPLGRVGSIPILGTKAFARKIKSLFLY